MKKLQYFEEVVSREVELRKRRAKHRLAKDLSKECAAEIEAAQERVDLRVNTARNNLTRKSNSENAVALRDAKAAHFSLRKSFQSQILDDVREELISFANSSKYDDYLLPRIERVKADFAVVKLRPEDMRLAEKIRDTTGLTPVEGDSDYLGGFILQSENGKIRADYTFRTRLENIGSTWTDL